MGEESGFDVRLHKEEEKMVGAFISDEIWIGTANIFTFFDFVTSLPFHSHSHFQCHPTGSGVTEKQKRGMFQEKRPSGIARL